ncbi:MAG: hypothetical protein DI539_10370 [Flavobacterium psychrophilum]|nr:MAG: hypothetical protein DI539_10370 [Flavobacterium psychrophilum]
MLLENVNLVFIIIPFIIGGVIYTKIARHKIGDPLRDSIQNLQVMLMVSGAMFMVMWILLPSTPSLSTFGYPETIEDINSQEKILKILQGQNKAIVRTTETIQWTLFILTFWILVAVTPVLKAIKDKIDLNLQAKHDEKAV